MKGTVSLSWGTYGGFYLHRRRVCLGWVALTYVPHYEIDDLMEAYVAVVEIKDTQGQVCRNFERCTHGACRSSYSSWAIADRAVSTGRSRDPGFDELSSGSSRK